MLSQTHVVCPEVFLFDFVVRPKAWAWKSDIMKGGVLCLNAVES